MEHKPQRGDIDFIDFDEWVNVLADVIYEQGEIVHELVWDSGGPGGGGDEETIYKFRDYYWPNSSVEGLSGPYNSLEEALQEHLVLVNDATQSIRCTELSTVDLLKRLIVGETPGHKIQLNGESWRVSKDCTLERVTDAGR